MSKHVLECARAGCFYTTIDNRDGLSCPECSAALIAVREAKHGEIVGFGKQSVGRSNQIKISDKLEYLGQLQSRPSDHYERIQRVCDSIEKDLGLQHTGGYLTTSIELNGEKIAQHVSDAVKKTMEKASLINSQDYMRLTGKPMAILKIDDGEDKSKVKYAARIMVGVAIGTLLYAGLITVLSMVVGE